MRATLLKPMHCSECGANIRRINAFEDKNNSQRIDAEIECPRCHSIEYSNIPTTDIKQETVK